ncbi:MAG: Rieske 2Fe-2S domain-containing protein, partial [Candidatus Sericytochromatia bacterium]
MQLVKNLWYAILQSKEVKKNKPLGTERLGQKLVLWRDAQGQLHCHQDRCPHLGAALSLGEICGNHLVCPFHGFEFDTQGECQLIPANGKAGKIPLGMRTQTYRVQEAHGFIWLWWGEPQAEYPAVPFFDELGSGWYSDTVIADWEAHFTRAIENQLDVAHLAFVHRTT